MLTAQKITKLSHIVHGCEAASPRPNETLPASVHQLPDPKIAAPMPKTARAPIQVWMPNQPQATPARRSAGRLAPQTPKEARATTGYGIPYFVPEWLMSSIGIRTMRLPRPIVSTAWTQSIPIAMRPAASAHDGMLIDIPTHRAR